MSKKISSSVTKLYGILNEDACIIKHTTKRNNPNSQNLLTVNNKGDLIHILAKEIIDNKLSIRSLDEKIDEYLARYNKIKLTPFEQEKAKNFLTKYIYNSFKDVENKKSEEPIESSGGLIRGQIDLIINDKIIIDYKTGKIDKSNTEKYSFQLKIYSAIYSRKINKEIKRAYILGLDGKEYNIEIDDSNKLLSSLENKINKLNINQNFTYNATSQNCLYCHYQKKCEAFWKAVENKKDDFFEKFISGEISTIKTFNLGRMKIIFSTGEKITIEKEYTNKINGITEGESYKFLNIDKKGDKKYSFRNKSEIIKI